MHEHLQASILELDTLFSPYIGKASQSFETQSCDRKIAVGSSVTVFIVTAILFFFGGFLSRHFCQRKRKTTVPHKAHKAAKKDIPYYDDVVLKQQGHELELKENVAYVPV